MKLLIVDDEPLARKRLARLVEDTGMARVVGEAGDGGEALDLIATLGPDLLLLDIAMPGLDGLATARELQASNGAPKIIFTTACEQHALTAFEVDAIDYLLKPVKASRLQAALEKARDQLATRSAKPRYISARVQDELVRVPLSEVLCLVADQKYVKVRHSQGRLLIHQSLKELEKEFSGELVRIHRGALVPINRMTALVRDTEGRLQVRIRGLQQPLEVSRRHAPAVRALMKADHTPGS